MSNLEKDKLSNLMAEQSILGALLLDETLVCAVKESGLTPKDFYYSYNQVIFKTMRKIYKDGNPIDIITLTDELRNIGMLENCGGVSYISSLSSIVTSTSNLNYHIKIVRDLAIKRNIADRMYIILDNIEVNAISEISEELEKINEVSKNNKSVEDLFIDSSTIKRNKEARKSINTGFKELDKKTYGLVYGSLTVLTGEPSSGKSTILNQIIANAITENHKAFIYSGELPSYQLKEWFVRTIANGYHLKEFENKLGEKYKDITDYVWDLVSEWIKNKFFIYGDDARATESNLVTTIEYLHTRKGVRLFILDNLMTVENRGNKDKNLKQEELASNLKRLAKKYNLVIILVAHPNKSSSQSKGNASSKDKNNQIEHSMYDVSGASEVVNLADYVIKIIRKKVENEGDRSYLMILKNRTTGKQNIIIRTYFDNDRKRFYIDGSELTRDYGYDKNKQFVQVDINSPF